MYMNGNILLFTIPHLSFHPDLAQFSHFIFPLAFYLYKNWPYYFNYMALLQLINFLYAISSFMFNYLLSSNCSNHHCVSLHFSNIWTTFSSSLQGGFLHFLHLSLHLSVSKFPIYTTLTQYCHSSYIDLYTHLSSPLLFLITVW